MKIKTSRLILTVLLSLSLTGASMAQGRFSVYVGVGGMYYLGDLKETALPDFKTVKLAINAGVHYDINTRWGVQLHYLHGMLAGDDGYASAASKQLRGLKFNTKIDELSLRITFNILREKVGRVVPYITAGGGMFHFNPTADGMALQPLGTEGQYIAIGDYPAPYSLWQFVIPVGLGVRYRFNCNWGVKLEGVYHITFTDYIDDVSTYYPDPTLLLASPGGATSVYYSDPTGARLLRSNRGSADKKDSYIDLSLSLIYYIGRCDGRNAKGDRYQNCEDLYKNLH
jgi:opacity protein-like surface antigen